MNSKIFFINGEILHRDVNIRDSSILSYISLFSILYLSQASARI